MERTSPGASYVDIAKEGNSRMAARYSSTALTESRPPETDVVQTLAQILAHRFFGCQLQFRADAGLE
jgi:hypothetical protein